jgi:glutamate carboxypeptidase
MDEEPLAAAIGAAARGRRARLVEMLGEITGLDAPSGDPEALVAPASLLVSWLEELGARPALTSTAAGPLIDASLGEAEDAPVLLLCHYDTVWPRGTAAERPFEVRERVARGPGVLDMRGGIVACFGALATLAELDLPGGAVRILLTPDEETGSEASRTTILSAARAARLVLVPEPALPDGSLKTSRKGWLLVRLVAHGVAAHAGLEPERGASAVDELLAALARVEELREPSGGTTVNVGLLGSPNPANVVAETAEATVDLRFVDEAGADRARAALAALRPRDRRASLDVRELHFRPPLTRTAAGGAAAAWVSDLSARLGLGPIGEGHAGGVSDANLAAAVAAVPILDGLGPVGGGAHAREEWVGVDSLVERSALIALMLTTDGTRPDQVSKT